LTKREPPGRSGVQPVSRLALARDEHSRGPSRMADTELLLRVVMSSKQILGNGFLPVSLQFRVNFAHRFCRFMLGGSF
jgi:hypothetical protein